MYTDSVKAIVITDDIIENLHTPAVAGWSQVKNDRLNTEHRALLRLAQQHPAGVEVMAWYDDNLDSKIISVGTQGTVKADTSSGAIYIHNHPSGNTFTLKDVRHFLLRDNMKVLTAVGNNGIVYLLQKAEHYSFTEIYHSLQEIIQVTPDFEDSPEKYIDFMEKFLLNVREYGLIYRKTR